MIGIDRNRFDENGDPIRPSAVWFTQAAQATAVAIQEQGSHTADKQIYSDVSVRMALEELFYDKCAYCETRSNAGADWDVEHYRPKGRVAERSDHPGYYWLAYAWENLFPSCQHCNQRRKDKPRWGDMSMGYAKGKLDQFPLEDESKRALAHYDDLDAEKPLLINPCADNPEYFLGYDPLGQVYAVNDNAQGRATIDLCHLKRRRLRDARKEVINTAMTMMAFHRRLLGIGSAEAIADFLGMLQEHLFDNHCAYAGAARFVRDHPENFGL